MDTACQLLRQFVLDNFPLTDFFYFNDIPGPITIIRLSDAKNVYCFGGISGEGGCVAPRPSLASVAVSIAGKAL